MTIDERDLTPPGVFTMFPLELPADLLSGGNGLQRNLDRMAERVREDGIAEFMETPEAQAAQAELVGEAKARVAAVLAARRKLADQQRPIDPSLNHQDWGWCIRCRLERYEEGHDRLCAWCWERSSHSASPAAQVAVDMAEAEAYGATVPDDGCWRPEQANPRGRWRTKKRVLRQLAEDLNYPECMEVAHPEQIDGAVMQAGVRLRDFYKLHRVRTTPAQAKAERAQRRVDKREMARAIARGEPPF